METTQSPTGNTHKKEFPKGNEVNFSSSLGSTRLGAHNRNANADVRREKGKLGERIMITHTKGPDNKSNLISFVCCVSSSELASRVI